MMLTGYRVPGAELYRLGVVEACTPPEELMTAAMEMADGEQSGLAIGAWGAVQATASGVAIAIGGAVRDAVTSLGAEGALGQALASPASGYDAVYHIEILLLLATLVAIGPLVRTTGKVRSPLLPAKFGLSEFPG